MRVQIMPLTSVTVGEHTHTPFVIVIDGADTDTLIPEMIVQLQYDTNAAGVWVNENTMDVGTPLTLTDEQAQSILDRLNAA